MNGNDVSRQCPKHENSWLIRNDSSNVSAILNSQPYSFEYESSFLSKRRKPVVVSDHCCKADKPQRCFCEECYCTKSPVYPKLTVTPPGHRCDKPKILRCRKLKHGCKCDYAKYYLASLQNKGYLDMQCLHYTTPRQAYEKFKAQEQLKQNSIKTFKTHADEPKPEEQLIKPNELTKFNNIDGESSMKADKYIEASTEKFSKSHSRACASPVLTTILENEQEEVPTNTETSNDSSTSEIVMFNSNASIDVNLKRLNTFRKENYFECHSTTNFCSKIPDHKCVHKFVLDNRLVPQPLHADAFGTSRCIICYKPINSERNSCSHYDGKTLTKNIPKSQKNVFKKPCCSMNKTPHRIYISNRNERIEIKVPLSYEAHDDLFKTCFKIKNPISANSLALRHQKGVV